MINSQDIMQLKAFARQDGALTALLWTVSFALVMTMPEMPWGNLFALATPFFVGWRLICFRNDALNGLISFRRSYAYGVYTFFYASLLFAVAQYVYFRFLDQGMFNAMIANSLQLVEPIYKQSGIDIKEMQVAMNEMMAMKPIQWAFMFMIQNMMVGLVLSFPIAFVCKRRHPKANHLSRN